MTDSSSLFKTDFITDAKVQKPGSDICILPVFEGQSKISVAGDETSSTLLGHHLKNGGAFKGKAGQTLVVSAPVESAFKVYLLIGMGEAKKLDELITETAAGKSWSALKALGHKTACLDLNVLESKDTALPVSKIGAHLVNGLMLASYDFTKYKTGKDDKDSGLKSLTIALREDKDCKKLLARLKGTTEAALFARDLVNTPPNYLLPDMYAKQIKERLKPLGVKVTVLDEKKLLKMGMGALMAVAQGSDNPPRVAIMEWNGNSDKKKTSKPLAFVGKGVTFDTGGISLKPGAGMEDMKLDMGGSAAVVGLMESLAKRKAKAHVVGIVGLVENMPDGKAYRPADVVTSLSGKTIEVLNTDAEGRLVLADCLTHIQREFDPSLIVDLATLTGAMMVALGFEYCGTFSNDDELWRKLEKASDLSGEKLWRMPLGEAYTKEMDSPIADIKNLGTQSRFAGACTAAAFLEAFVDKGRAWAHMDVAGTAWIKSPKPTATKGGTGFGVRVLDTFVEENYG
ncbi:MAG: leucyl aminopeptidase [Alphaproteobacteria bacterium]|mgnify:CR=1 FL=1|nr:leucyl aminopeptidase [Alphaproteobacteria bacterium]